MDFGYLIIMMIVFSLLSHLPLAEFATDLYILVGDVKKQYKILSKNCLMAVQGALWLAKRYSSTLISALKTERIQNFNVICVSVSDKISSTRVQHKVGSRDEMR